MLHVSQTLNDRGGFNCTWGRNSEEPTERMGRHGEDVPLTQGRVGCPAKLNIVYLQAGVSLKSIYQLVHIWMCPIRLDAIF